MITINRMLCPIDFSSSSDDVLASAAAIARHHRATLTVMHVAAGYPVPSGPAPGRRQSVQERWLDRLWDVTTPLRETQGGILIVVREGEPRRRILEEAEAGRADLIVMGTKGRSGLNRLLLGSVAESVLRHASCPVLTVPPAGSERTVPARGGLFSRILCPIDFSAASLAAAGYGLALAQEAQGELVLLHVFETSAAALGAPALASEMRAHGDLARLVPDEARDWCAVETRVAIGDAGEAILRAARDEAADLVVMGAPRAAGRGWSIDSTAGRVVREAPCPVVTLRPDARAVGATSVAWAEPLATADAASAG